MYYHGLEGVAHQVTRVATSVNGIDFVAQPQVLGRPYFRAFTWQDMTYGLAMPGRMYRGEPPFGPFTAGPRLFNPNMRHSAVLVRDGQLMVFWTEVGDAPEHIKLSTIDLLSDWQDWQNTVGVEILRPQFDWEGAAADVVPSIRSSAYGRVNQLRDPAIYVEDQRVYLLYAVAGEAGIALAEIHFNSGTM